jgi:hypothetical protein
MLSSSVIIIAHPAPKNKHEFTINDKKIHKMTYLSKAVDFWHFLFSSGTSLMHLVYANVLP